MALLRARNFQGLVTGPSLTKGRLLSSRASAHLLPSCRRNQFKSRCSLSFGGLLAGFQSAFPIFNSPFGRMSASTAEITDKLEISRIPCLSDNYVWLLKEPVSGLTAIVDASEVNPIVRALDERGEKLDFILNTHHHWDHTGGNIELKNRYGCKIVGPAADESRIPGIDIALKDSEVWKFGNLDMVVWDTPGHTRGHITLHFPEAGCLFPGDTLFAMGCGRLFEGNAEQMWTSLSKMMVLPPETRVYSAHEYTQSNAKFALTVDPQNSKLIARKKQVDDMRAKGIPTLPSTIQDELDTNPFFRAPHPDIRARLGVSTQDSDVAAFAAVRTAKDKF
ncbi:hypothetical protein BSKO_04459 [Bryopsis sp. KO-2023]|nr:hypothetical protein BSKO_04459 [Bryopsis sp. KO-2023]